MPDSVQFAHFADSYARPAWESQPETLSGAQIAVRLLERQGVRLIAGIPGGPILPFYDALLDSRQIRHVLARHEQGAGFIAQGWARATGEAGVCVASSGPGATNLVTALADANLDSIPLVAITAQVPRALIGTDAFQEVDTCGITRAAVKHNFMIERAESLLEVIPRAFEIALSGRPGPVLLDIPKDVFTDRVDMQAWPAPGGRRAVSRPDSEAVADAAHLINNARRPVLYLGGGVIHAGAADLARALAETAALPTTMTLMGLGAMPPCHPLSLGMLGMHGARHTNLALEECDLLIAIGARFDDRATGKASGFCPHAEVIHIDIDPSELSKIKTATIGITGDARAVLELLLPQVRPPFDRCHRELWLARIEHLKQMHPLHLPAIEDPRSHYGLVRAVAASVPTDVLVTTDVGQHQMWAAQAFPVTRSRQWLTSGGLGTMGFGLPAAIGAALARPERTVVCFSGDGSLLMNLQELATAAECGVNVKVVLMNNASLGLVHQQQSLFYGGRLFASQYQRQIDFLAVAHAFGVRSLDLDVLASPFEVNAALAAELQSPGPALIHVSIDANEKVFPMVPPGSANTHMLDHDCSSPDDMQKAVGQANQPSNSAVNRA